MKTKINILLVLTMFTMACEKEIPIVDSPIDIITSHPWKYYQWTVFPELQSYDYKTGESLWINDILNNIDESIRDDEYLFRDDGFVEYRDEGVTRSMTYSLKWEYTLRDDSLFITKPSNDHEFYKVIMLTNEKIIIEYTEKYLEVNYIFTKVLVE